MPDKQLTTTWEKRYPAIASRGIDESTWNAITNSVYPGAHENSVLMAVDYCRARDLDILQKPVHIVPMSVKDSKTGNYEYRDVVMPGVGLYRIQADRTGNYAGADEPVFGPKVTEVFEGKGSKRVEVAFPEWCKVTVYKMIEGVRCPFTATEFWLENYATENRYSEAPNSMWKKRRYGQLAKCAEAQALRKAWPEVGQAPTAEEMLGKAHHIDPDDEDIKAEYSVAEEPKPYPQEDFDKHFPAWEKGIKAGKTTADKILVKLASKGQPTETQIKKLRDVKVEVADGNS